MLEQRLETENQFVNVLKSFHEQWKDRVTLDNRRLVENYVKGKVHFLVLIKDTIKPGNQFVALIKWALPIPLFRDDVESECVAKVNVRGNLDSFFFEHVSSHPAPEESGRSKVGHDGTSGYQHAVLVDIVKLIESPKAIVPSLVRFGRVDSIYCRLCHALYFSFTLGFVFRGTIGINNGKSDPFSFCPGESNTLSVATDLHQMPNEMVKGASHVVDSFPGNQRDDRDHRLGASKIMLSQCIGKLRMWPDTNFVRIPVQKFSDFPFQLLDVLVRPCGFYAGNRETLIGS